MMRTSAAGVMVAALLAGCGGQSSGTAPSGGSEPVKVGMITSLTGAYTTLGTNDRLGAEQAVAEINAAGGAAGHQLQLLVEDDQTKPDQALLAFTKLNSEGVAAFVGSSFSNNSLAIIQGDLDRKKVPYVSTAAADQQVDPIHAYAFMTPPTARRVAERLLQYAKQQNFTRLVVAHDTKSAFADSGWAATQAKATQYGITLVEKQFEPAADYTPLVTQMRDAGAQAGLVWVTGAPAVVITKKWKELGLTIPLMFSHAEASSLFAQPSGPAAEGVVVATSLGVPGNYLPDKHPAKKVILDMASTFKKNNGAYPPTFAFDGYNAVKLIAAAIKAKGAGPANIQKGLEALTLLTPEGTYHYSPTDHAGLGLDAVVITKITGGEFVPTDFSKQLLEQSK